MGLFPWSLSLIALAAIAAGIVGAILPTGERLDSILALIAGAGVGVLVIAVGLITGANATSGSAMERLFFVGSCVGAVAVLLVLLVLWRHARAHHG
ncbi:MAG: hypothetical protein ACXVQU_08820 [Actinomycetota bacterium]